ncbi:acetylglutamate kinase [Alteromonas oceanisediminis]|uniref:acetylglutamate kinase n=1 Tax=Alteromonas oceanisediminis TaxID=2836180 RepID=UPI001BDAFBA8|nr:acetylglutamate kinase [Alteromonas oceanisediminis]MBT0586080.1 acetylglutamate kinase [Alteromonas oceanisediminis]
MTDAHERSVVVLKVGGALIDNLPATQALFTAVAELPSSIAVVIVHGGGSNLDALLSQLQLSNDKVDGLRISPDAHMPYVVGALAGTSNKQLCAAGYALGLSVVGLSLFDGDSVSCTELNPKLGAVGVPQPNSAAFLTTLLSRNYLPVMSSIGCDKQGRLYNVNADQAATAIAQLLSADLYLLSDVSGVLDADKLRVHSLSPLMASELVTNGTIAGGMRVKVTAAQLAANTLGRSVTIGSWAEPEALLAHIMSVRQPSIQFGTQVLPQEQRQQQEN